MSKPTTEELILKELKAIHSLLEGLTSKSETKQEPTPHPFSKVKGLDPNLLSGR